MLDNTPNQQYKLIAKNWVERKDDSRVTYNTNGQIQFKTLMLKSGFCDYSEAYIFVNGVITITRAGEDNAAKGLDEGNKGVISKNCAPFTDCIREINNTQVDNAKDLDIAITMYNLIEYGDNYSKTSGSLWQYYNDQPEDILTNSELFKFKMKIT